MSEQVNMATHYEHEIPEGYEARIEGNKVIIEPKESEDERVRKEIIDYFYGCIKRNSKSGFHWEQYKSWIAYLEKQKECSFCDSPKSCADCPKEIQAAIDKEFGIDGRDDNDNPLNGYGDWKKGMVLNGPAIWGLVKLGIELQKEQKPNIELIQRSWYMEGYHDREFCREPKWIIKTGEGGPKYEKNEKYGQPLEQKPMEWSEKDFNIRNNLADYLTGELKLTEKAKLDGANWLKSLPERFNLHPQQEWSEEDNEQYLSCLKRLGTGNPDQPETVNSKWFREHVCPHPHWKPSNLELGALRTAIIVLTEERNFQRAGKHLQDILDHFEGKETRHDWKPSEEQMDALNQSLSEYGIDGDVYRNLCSLYDDLKKLM